MIFFFPISLMLAYILGIWQYGTSYKVVHVDQVLTLKSEGVIRNMENYHLNMFNYIFLLV